MQLPTLDTVCGLLGVALPWSVKAACLAGAQAPSSLCVSCARVGSTLFHGPLFRLVAGVMGWPLAAASVLCMTMATSLWLPGPLQEPG